MMNTERIWVLMAKRKSGEATDDELNELTNLLHNEEENIEDEIVDKIWNAPLQPLPEMKPGKGLWNRIEKTIEERPIKTLVSRRIIRWMGAAAIVTALFITGVFLLSRQKDKKIAFVQNVITQPFSKKHLVLPDGTNVWLNGNSTLSFNGTSFGHKYREVKLIGEAFFDVTKNAEHPFIIHAGTINIIVKGTAFNVKAYPGQKKVETSLIRGLVEITTQQDPERRILLKPNEKISISTEKELKQPLKEIETPLFAISKLHIDEKNILPETVWMNASLSFDNEALEKLAPKLESWFSVTIYINDDALKAKRFSGMIKGETLEQTLNALKLSYPFSYIIKNGEVWINK